MKRLFVATASLLSASAILCGAVQADLGEAEQSVQVSDFDAFCSKSGNKCRVSFTSERMIVSGGKGIARQQIIRIWGDREMRGFWDRTPGNYYHPVYYVTYRKEDGSDATGKFLFIDESAGSKFWNALNVFLGPGRRPIGPSIKIE